ncbi:hypothetical protein GDO81_014333 [Engystomops pustulosus]|uniref:Myb-like domain-containing protein n=1 Tax=Engystomops pustulosus TaxID=76066 RepID=A0AAV7BA79_ENGPU|nr:hypothetical protein GDO81_014333 [Engystomops pustulosus]
MRRLMKITDFFQSPSSSTNQGEERPAPSQTIDDTREQEESMSGSITVQTPRKKRERFTDPEVQKLVDTILLHIQQLFGPKSVNAASKGAIWDKVVKEVNKVGGKKRTVEECRKKWFDYKRKVKKDIDNVKMHSTADAQLSLSELFTRRQMMVAQFFKMDVGDGQKLDVLDESSTDIGECVSTNDHVLPPAYIIDSEDEFHPSQNKSFSSSFSQPSTSHQDKSVSQSFKEPQFTSEPGDPHNSNAVDTSIPPHTSTERQVQLETQVKQSLGQPKNIYEVLQSIQKDVSATLKTQNKMYKLVKDSFLELHNTLLSSQKASSDHSNILELRLSSLNAKLDEMNRALRVKQLQDMMSSDESEITGTQDVNSTPTGISTPITSQTPMTSTPARKRILDQSLTPVNLLKRQKQSQ